MLTKTSAVVPDHDVLQLELPGGPLLDNRGHRWPCRSGLWDIGCRRRSNTANVLAR